MGEVGLESRGDPGDEGVEGDEGVVEGNHGGSFAAALDPAP